MSAQIPVKSFVTHYLYTIHTYIVEVYLLIVMPSLTMFYWIIFKVQPRKNYLYTYELLLYILPAHNDPILNHFLPVILFSVPEKNPVPQITCNQFTCWYRYPVSCIFTFVFSIVI